MNIIIYMMVILIFYNHRFHLQYIYLHLIKVVYNVQVIIINYINIQLNKNNV